MQQCQIPQILDDSAFSTLPLPTKVLASGRPGDALRQALPARPRQAAGTGHDTNTYEMIGLIAKFFKQRFAFGFYALVPNGNFTVLQAPYVDEREQYFSNSLHPELYADRLTAISLAAATERTAPAAPQAKRRR